MAKKVSAEALEQEAKEQEEKKDVKLKGSEALKTVAKLAEKQLRIANRILKVNDELKELAKEYKQVAEVDLPELMDEIGLAEFKLKAGGKVTIKKETYVNISKAQKPFAYSWLEKKGFGHIIKQEAVINFGKGEEKSVKALENLLQQRKLLRDLPYSVNASIHHKTLQAFVKEQQAKGVQFPEKGFNIYDAKKAVIET